MERRGSGAAIDDGRGAGHACAGRLRHAGGFHRRTSRGDDVFDDEDAIGGAELESPTQCQRPIFPLGKQGTDAQAARDLLTNHDAAECRRQHGRRLQVLRAPGQRLAERSGKLRVLQDERALKISLAVQTRRQAEVAIEESPRSPEQIENIVLGHASVPSLLHGLTRFWASVFAII